VNLTKIAAIEKAADAGKPAGGAPESF
jgi:hypothetical protein